MIGGTGALPRDLAIKFLHALIDSGTGVPFNAVVQLPFYTWYRNTVHGEDSSRFWHTKDIILVITTPDLR